ncbi:hypothetical protein [Anaerosporobacter sp.]
MYYGIDSDTAVFPTGSTSHDFYAGRIGYGLTANSTYFNNTGASLAKKVYMYWGIQGPEKDSLYESASSYTSTLAHNWGAQQASSAVTALSFKTNVNMYTIFADIESGFGGWLTSSDISTYSTLNYQVFKGFVDKITSSYSKYYTGVYTSKGSWQSIMGTTNSPGYAKTVWGANYPSGSTFNTPPTSMSGCYSINGIAPTIWQYYGEMQI